MHRRHAPEGAPARPRRVRRSFAPSAPYTPQAPKSWRGCQVRPGHVTWFSRASRTAGHREQLVHSGVAKNIVDVRIDVDQADPRTRRNEPLVGLQKHAEAGAGNVFQSAPSITQGGTTSSRNAC